MYDNISIALFVSGYMLMMEAEKLAITPLMAQHIQERMGDAELYRWEPVHACHAVWLQQLQHGRVTQADEESKLKFRRALVWHSATAAPKLAAAALPPPPRRK